MVCWKVLLAINTTPLQIIAYLLLSPNSLLLSRVCLVAMFVSFACGIAAVCLLWHSTYPDYNFAQGEPCCTTHSLFILCINARKTPWAWAYAAEKGVCNIEQSRIPADTPVNR